MWGVLSINGVALTASVLAATSTPQVERRGAVVIELPAPGGRVQAQTTSDRHHLLLVTQEASSAFLKAAQKIPIHADLTVEVRETAWGGAEVLVGSVDPIEEHALSHNGGRLRLELHIDVDFVALRSRIRNQLRRSAPGAFLSPSFRAAEDALQKLSLQDAAIGFRKLTKEYALRSWALLRLGDVQVLKRDRGAACDQYGAVAEQFGDRSAGVLARLRFQALHCRDRGRKSTDWQDVFARVQYLDGPIGHYLFEETQWTVERLFDARDLHFVLEQGRAIAVPPGRPRLLTDATAARLVARVMRVEKRAVDRAATYWRYAPLIATNAEARALLLIAAQAFEAIDLADQAVAVVNQLSATRRPDASTLWDARRGDVQTRAWRVRSVLAAGELELADELAEQYRTAFGHRAVAESATRDSAVAVAIEQRVSEVHERMRRISEAMVQHGSPHNADGVRMR